MKIGSRMVALAVVAEMNADSTMFMTMKLKNTPRAVFPNLSTNHSAKRLATRVLTSMLARTNESMFSHITGCPSWANASFCEVTPVRTMARVIISEVR